MDFCKSQILLPIFCRYFFSIDTVKLLQVLHLFETFLLNHCSAGVTETNPILIHYQTISYTNLIPNFNLS